MDPCQTIGLRQGLAGFEKTSRALFANDAAKFRQRTEAWPSDVCDYVSYLAYPLPLTEVTSLAA